MVVNPGYFQLRAVAVIAGVPLDSHDGSSVHQTTWCSYSTPPEN